MYAKRQNFWYCLLSADLALSRTRDPDPRDFFPHKRYWEFKLPLWNPVNNHSDIEEVERNEILNKMAVQLTKKAKSPDFRQPYLHK